MHKYTIGLGLVGLVIIGSLSLWRMSTHQPQPPLPMIAIAIKGQALQVEVADTEVERQHGLMFRQELAAGHGMLFVFSQPEQLSFWMKNTSLPLSIAFVGADGRIQRIADMQPFDRTMLTSPTPAQYAIEVPQGWFVANNIQAGDVVTGLP